MTKARNLALALVLALSAVATPASAQEEEPTKWEQLFFPFPIVGAPPQLEQQVQLFNSYFHGRAGTGDVPSAEVAVRSVTVITFALALCASPDVA